MVCPEIEKSCVTFRLNVWLLIQKALDQWTNQYKFFFKPSIKPECIHNKLLVLLFWVNSHCDKIYTFYNNYWVVYFCKSGLWPPSICIVFKSEANVLSTTIMSCTCKLPYKRYYCISFRKYRDVLTPLYSNSA